MDLDLFVKVEPTLCQVRKRVSGRDVRVRHIAVRFQRSARNDEFVVGKRFLKRSSSEAVTKTALSVIIAAGALTADHGLLITLTASIWPFAQVAVPSQRAPFVQRLQHRWSPYRTGAAHPCEAVSDLMDFVAVTAKEPGETRTATTRSPRPRTHGSRRVIAPRQATRRSRQASPPPVWVCR